jgi:hypothetical protein
MVKEPEEPEQPLEEEESWFSPEFEERQLKKCRRLLREILRRPPQPAEQRAVDTPPPKDVPPETWLGLAAMPTAELPAGKMTRAELKED